MSMWRKASRALLLGKSSYHFNPLRSLSTNMGGRGGWSEEEEAAKDEQQRFHLPNPNPNPNRPLRGDSRPPPPPHSPPFQIGFCAPGGRRGPRKETETVASNQQRPSFPVGENKPKQQPVDRDSFLEKFKLGFNTNQDQDTPQAPTQKNTVCSGGDTSAAGGDGDSPEDADEIFKKMKETGLIPNAVAMLDALCKDGLPQEAMKLFALMREKGTIPEIVIYTAVVQGFCKAHKFDDAKRIFAKMHTNGIAPNAFTYTVLIQGLCKGGPTHLDDAVHFTLEMLEAGHSPNVATFTGLVCAFCNHKGVEEAQSVVNTLREKGFFLNDKAVRDHLDKKGPSSPLLREAIFGKKTSQTFF